MKSPLLIVIPRGGATILREHTLARDTELDEHNSIYEPPYGLIDSYCFLPFRNETTAAGGCSPSGVPITIGLTAGPRLPTIEIIFLLTTKPSVPRSFSVCKAFHWQLVAAIARCVGCARSVLAWRAVFHFALLDQ